MEPVLHNYFRSSTSIRVRIAMNLKGMRYDYRAWHLRKGEQTSEAYRHLNPHGLVPALELSDGTVLTQSLAIIDYLDETIPHPPLLPTTPAERARVRGLALAVACEIHPVNNLRVLGRLRSQFGADDAGVTEWFRHWVAETFVPLEHTLATAAETGRFCHRDQSGLADICLYAQFINNRRFGVDMTPYPTIARICAACDTVEAFAQAAPDRQPDAE